MRKTDFIKEYKPILKKYGEVVDFKWFSEEEMTEYPNHQVWTLKHCEEGGSDYLASGYSRVNSLHRYVMTEKHTKEWVLVEHGVYRDLKPTKDRLALVK